MSRRSNDRDDSGRGCLRYLFGLILILILVVLFVIFVIPKITLLGVGFSNILGHS